MSGTELPEQRAVAATDDSPFVELLDRTSRVKILDVFLTREAARMTQSRIEELSGLNQSSVSRNIDAFVEVGLVDALEADQRRYRLNTDHAAVEGLLEAHLALHTQVEELRAAESEDGEESGLADYESGSPFVHAFRTPGLVKILDVFLTREAARMKASRIAECSGVNITTVYRNVPTLEDLGLIEKVSTDPNRYRLDQDHEAVEGLLNAHLALHTQISALKRELPVEGAPIKEDTAEKIRKELTRAVADAQEGTPDTQSDSANGDKLSQEFPAAAGSEELRPPDPSGHRSGAGHRTAA